MAEMHRIYDPVSIAGLNFGPQMVDLFERLYFFRVFSAPWFIFLLTLLVVSIVVCTLDRTPRMWRGVRHVKLVQAPAFYDLQLPERASFAGAGDAAADELAAVLKGHRYRLRMDDGSEEEIAFISVTSKPTGDVVVFERYREGPNMSKG